MLLDSVLGLLDRDERLTYEAVARDAAVSRQTVYTHFPTRADLLLGAVQRARQIADVESAARTIYAAPTAIAALRELVDLHAAFVPRFLRAHLAIERERSSDPDVAAAFATRTGGRRHLAIHVATRLHAEGDLAEPWTVQTAGELIDAVTSGTFTAQLLSDLRWSTDDVRQRVLVLLQRTLLDTIQEEP